MIKLKYATFTAFATTLIPSTRLFLESSRKESFFAIDMEEEVFLVLIMELCKKAVAHTTINAANTVR